MAAETASSKNGSKSCEDSTKVVVHAELETAMRQLWERVDAELHVIHRALRSMNGIDIDLLASMNSYRSDPARAHYGTLGGNNLHASRSLTCNNVDSINIFGSVADEGIKESKTQTHKQEASVTHQGEVDGPPIREFSSANLHDLVSPHQGSYVWGNTLWDACAFVGTNALGCGGSMLIIALTLLSILVQSVYIFIILELFDNNTLTDEYLRGLRQWRSLNAHDARYMNAVSGESLVSRVCGFDSSLELATQQKQTAWTTHVFLQDGFVHGPQVSLLAIFVFVTVVCVELRNSLMLIASLYEHVLSPSRTRISISKNIRIHSISRSRFMFMLLLTMVRIAIAISLSVGSIIFLMRLADVQSIFLMSMKFVFVLNIDELFFQALLPRFMKMMMTYIAPLYSRSARTAERTCFGCDMISFLFILCLVVALNLVKFFGVEATEDQLGLLQDALCGGNKNFVYTINPTDGVLEWAVTGDGSTDRNSFLEATVSELVTMRNSDLQFSLDGEAKMSRKSNLQRVIGLLKMAPGQEGTDSYELCVDKLDWFEGRKDDEHSEYHRLRAALNAVIEDDVTSCQNVSLSMCDQKHKHQVRALCPVRCGCGNFASGLYLNSPEHGCNRACFASTTVNGNLENITCVDVAKENLQYSSQWSRYWNGYVQSLSGENPLHIFARALALAHGCKIVPLIQRIGVDFCGGQQGGSPLTAFCPEACNCQKHEWSTLACPPSCGQFAELRSNQTFKYDCSDIPVLVPERAREECNFLVMDTVFYTFESLEPQCCAALNQVMGDVLTLGVVSDASIKLGCCLEGCLRELRAAPTVAILLDGFTSSDQCYS